ncbi:hypothetical protein AB6A40_002334 [Gnathostoma spinigerum]|uniref:Cell division control protein n=1 Tax=Gnathostoma spinigerum TaxID=75299 RepID=A0ABD6E7E7_9BILA
MEMKCSPKTRRKCKEERKLVKGNRKGSGRLSQIRNKSSGSVLREKSRKKCVISVTTNEEESGNAEMSDAECSTCIADEVSMNGEENAKESSRYLCGRESEMRRIEDYILSSISNNTSLSLYICGSPGTGKTASVKLVLEKVQKQHRLYYVYINCVQIRNQRNLHSSISSRLLQLSSSSPKKANVILDLIFQSSTLPIVIVLDEIDHLSTRSQELLYKTFQWPAVHKNVLLIGIANSLDMTERVLPKLKLTLSPVVIAYPPYSKDDLIEILMQKLSSLEENADPRAVELCARKVAAMTGDVRTAFQVASQMVTGICKQSDDSVDSTSRATSSCARVLSTLSNVYSSPLMRTRLPLQQRILLAVIVELAERSSSNVVDIGHLVDSYNKACSSLSFPAVDSDGVRMAVSLLASQSILEIKGLKCHLLIDRMLAKNVIADSNLTAQISNLSLK